MPSQSYAHHTLCFDRDNVLSETEVRKILVEHGFDVSNMSYRITDDGASFEYRMVLQTGNEQYISTLAAHLLQLRQVKSFRLSPTGD